MDTQKTDLSKILAVNGKHGLYRFLALSRGNAVIAEALADNHRTVFDAHNRITTLADICIFTAEGEMKLKEVFLALQKALAGKLAVSAYGRLYTKGYQYPDGSVVDFYYYSIGRDISSSTTIKEQINKEVP